MSENGFYYLHENGDLIWRRFAPEQDAGGFVRHVWPVENSRFCAWRIVVEALALGATRERIDALADKWGLTDSDAKVYASRIGLNLRKVISGNGPAHYEVAVPGKRIHLGLTVLDALAEFVRQGGRLP
jgi:hypothetical protein